MSDRLTSPARLSRSDRSPARRASTEVKGSAWDPRYLVVIFCAAFVAAADQALKALVIEALSRGRTIDFLGGLVRFDFTRNSGAAFGMFRSDGSIFAVMAIGVGLAIIFFHRRIARSSLPVRLGLGLVLGGAVGNLIDRIRLGYVVDYVDLRWWYVFNLADSAIVIGVGLLLLQSSLESRIPPTS